MHDEGMQLTPTVRGPRSRSGDRAGDRALPAGRSARAAGVGDCGVGGAPRRRPAAAALAAGETPSPEMVAAAGAIEAVPVAVRPAGACVRAGADCSSLVALSGARSYTQLVPLDKAPPVLADRARPSVGQRSVIASRPAIVSAGSPIRTTTRRWARDSASRARALDAARHRPSADAALLASHEPAAAGAARASNSPTIEHRPAARGQRHDVDAARHARPAARVQRGAAAARRATAGRAAGARLGRRSSRSRSCRRIASRPATPEWTPRPLPTPAPPGPARSPELGRPSRCGSRRRPTAAGHLVSGHWSVDAPDAHGSGADRSAAAASSPRSQVIDRRPSGFSARRCSRAGTSRWARAIARAPDAWRASSSLTALASWAFEARALRRPQSRAEPFLSGDCRLVVPGAILFWLALPRGRAMDSPSLARLPRRLDPPPVERRSRRTRRPRPAGRHRLRFDRVRLRARDALGSRRHHQRHRRAVVRAIQRPQGLRYIISDAFETVAGSPINAVFFVLAYVGLRRASPISARGGHRLRAGIQRVRW